MTPIETKVVVVDSDWPDRIAFEKAAQARDGWTATPPWDPGSGALHFERPGRGRLRLPRRRGARVEPGPGNWDAVVVAVAIVAWAALVVALCVVVAR